MASKRYLDSILDTILRQPGMRRIRQMISESKDELEQTAIIKYVTGQIRENLNGAKEKK